MKLPTVAVLTKLADVLGVSVTREAIYRALVNPMPTISEAPLVAEAHERVIPGVADMANVTAALQPARSPTAAAHR